jgi:hypothetical protein
MPKDKRIKWWDDERDIGNCLIVTLAHGWAFEPHDNECVAEHVRGFDTVKEARGKFRGVASARPCKCQRCQRGY